MELNQQPFGLLEPLVGLGGTDDAEVVGEEPAIGLGTVFQALPPLSSA